MEFSGLGSFERMVVKGGGSCFDVELVLVVEVPLEELAGDEVLSALARVHGGLEELGLQVKSTAKPMRPPRRPTASNPPRSQSLSITLTEGGALRLDLTATRKSASVEGCVVKLVLAALLLPDGLVRASRLVSKEDVYEIQISPAPTAQTDLFTPPPDTPAAKHAAKLLEGLKAGSRPFEEAVQVDVEEAIQEAKAKAQADEEVTPSSTSPPEALALSVRAQAEALLGRCRPKLLKHERVRELVDAIEGALLEGAVEEDFLHDFKLPSLTVPSLISSAQHQGKKARERALEEAAKSASLSLPPVPSNVISLPGPAPEVRSARGERGSVA